MDKFFYSENDVINLSEIADIAYLPAGNPKFPFLLVYKNNKSYRLTETLGKAVIKALRKIEKLEEVK